MISRWCPVNHYLYMCMINKHMIGVDSKKQVCLNEKCPDFGRKNAGHITKKGFNAKGNQMFKCKTCEVRFPETKGTIFYNRHLTEEQIILIYKLLVEKNGIRAIERIMEIHRNTISKIIGTWLNKRKLTKEMLTQIDMATAGHTSGCVKTHVCMKNK